MIFIPYWYFAVALGIPAGLLWIRFARARRVHKTHSCPKCNYSLTGLPAGSACPECGRGKATPS